jgi:hypothetical protein
MLTRDDIIQVSDLEELQEKTPFLIYIPDKIEVSNVTYRRNGTKWATLRFECMIEGEKLRVKEFFLDWFYPGFPKSLMDSFVSSYSSLSSSVLEDRAIFYGKNYKGKEASSSFSLGTQIEIEGETQLNIRKLSERMVAPFMNDRFENLPFRERSFFANGGKPEWFEEERISNLTWQSPSEKLCVGSLCLDSIGKLTRNGKSLETILVFSEGYYRRAAWVDIADSDSEVRHLIYDLRKGGNFFDVLEDGEPRIAFRKDSGITIAQYRREQSVTTISLSPLFQTTEINDLIGNLEITCKNPEKFI